MHLPTSQAERGVAGGAAAARGVAGPPATWVPGERACSCPFAAFAMADRCCATRARKAAMCACGAGRVGS